MRLWKLADGKDVGVFRKHGSPVVRAAFAENGRQTVSGDRDGVTLDLEHSSASCETQGKGVVGVSGSS